MVTTPDAEEVDRIADHWRPWRAVAAESVLVIGDSLSAAYGIDQQQGWVALLNQRFQREGLPYRAINASITGDTTRGGLTRLPAALQREAPAIVAIALGGNDGLRGLDLAGCDQLIVVLKRVDQFSGRDVVGFEAQGVDHHFEHLVAVPRERGL